MVRQESRTKSWKGQKKAENQMVGLALSYDEERDRKNQLDLHTARPAQAKERKRSWDHDEDRA